jgi:RND family efflux transporter MFP subunit
VKRALPSLLAAAALLGSGCGRGGAIAESAESESVLPVESLVVEQSTELVLRETHAGRLSTRRASPLGFERGGRVDRVLVETGDRVATGDALATLDLRSLRARQQQLAARLAEIEARLAYARRHARRVQELYEAGTIAERSRDEVTRDEKVLTAQRQAAVAALGALEVDLELSELRAPYAGTIAARDVDEGTVVAPGVPIVHLLETSALEATIGIPPRLAPELTIESRFEIEVNGRTFPAILHAVVPAVDADTGTVQAVFGIEPGEVRSQPLDGAVARLTLLRRLAVSGFWLPVSALGEAERGLWSTFVVVPDAESSTAWRVERRLLELLHAEPDRVYVRGGLRTGERVVASGIHRLVPGQRVRPTIAEATTTPGTSKLP